SDRRDGSTSQLMMIFSDLLVDPDPVLQSLRMLRHGGHDVILFHVFDEAEATFPFDGIVDLSDPESGSNRLVDADGIRADYLEAVNELCQRFRKECLTMGADYVRLDTSIPFGNALLDTCRNDEPGFEASASRRVSATAAILSGQFVMRPRLHPGDSEMPIHDWKNAPSGLFHHFHQDW